MIMKQKLINSNGITLVALIITIIVLIILAAVTIKFALDSNFIDIAKSSTENYAQSQIYDNEYIENTVDFLEQTVSNLISNQANYNK